MIERLGFLQTKFSAANGIHVHCASVGEVRAAIPLIKALINQYPNALIILTTSTPTGRRVARKISSDLAKLNASEINLKVCYLPIDWPGSCRRFLDSTNPMISLLMETELWPNFIDQCKRRGIPVLLANARMSERSLERYLKFPKLSLPMFASISSVAAQYESDKQRFLALGCTDEQVLVVGSIKFDIDISNKLKKEQQALKRSCCAGRPCWIAASIHPGEFCGVLDAHQQLLSKIPDLLLIAVPRHPEKFNELKNVCKEKKYSFAARSEQTSVSDAHSLIIGDSMGELMLLFGAADVAFVGGSLIARGGHNPIEPAACGLPVVMGTSDYNFADVCEIMENTGALVKVEGESQLASAIESLLLEKNTLMKKSQASLELVEKNKGAVKRLIPLIDRLVKID